MPVGISSRLPQEKEARTKPIDALAYLFWLQNQGKDIQLTVCDTIQDGNYEALYGLSWTQARQKALENGEMDKTWYGAAIKVFNLDRVSFGDYETLEKSRAVQDNLKLIARIEKENPTFKRALKSLEQPSLQKKARNNAKMELLQEYGKKEIAFILAKKDEIKIGHKKERRYDALAKIIPLYEELKKHIEEIPEIENMQDKTQALIELSVYLAHQQNLPPAYRLVLDLNSVEQKIREIKRKGKGKEKLPDMTNTAERLRQDLKRVPLSPKEKKSIEMMEKSIKDLGLLRQSPKETARIWQKRGQEISECEWFKNLKLPEFYYPESVTSLSFEIDSQGKEYMGFKEPYSTEKSDSEDRLPLEANQVIASTKPLAAAKISVLSEKNQALYFEKILKPLLVNFSRLVPHDFLKKYFC